MKQAVTPEYEQEKRALLLLRDGAVILWRTDFGDSTPLWLTTRGVIEEVDSWLFDRLRRMKAILLKCAYPVGVYELTARGMRYAFYVRQDLGLEPKDSRVIRPAGL